MVYSSKTLKMLALSGRMVRRIGAPGAREWLGCGMNRPDNPKDLIGSRPPVLNKYNHELQKNLRLSLVGLLNLGCHFAGRINGEPRGFIPLEWDTERRVTFCQSLRYSIAIPVAEVKHPAQHYGRNPICAK